MASDTCNDKRIENTGSDMYRVDFVAFGHENVIGKHKTTVEITSENTLTLQGTCIIGVKMGLTLSNLSDDIKNMAQSERTRIHLKMKANDESEEVIGYGSPRLTYESSISMVARTSPYECGRTLMVKANKAASDLSRQFIAELSEPDTQIDCELTFVNEELHQ
ncbi:MAG: DUF371 domain-containing protein [Candidatus Thorarchaeota archaeon]